MNYLNELFILVQTYNRENSSGGTGLFGGEGGQSSGSVLGGGSSSSSGSGILLRWTIFLYKPKPAAVLFLVWWLFK
tara:strand:- start:260 stop:487 length:228 start_codon:yes stop_codon:yes gene_type:complete